MLIVSDGLPANGRGVIRVCKNSIFKRMRPLFQTRALLAVHSFPPTHPGDSQWGFRLRVDGGYYPTFAGNDFDR